MTMYCAGIIDNNVPCPRRPDCAMHRLWWLEPNTHMHLCHIGKYNLFVPKVLQPAAPQPLQALPLGKTMELFA